MVLGAMETAGGCSHSNESTDIDVSVVVTSLCIIAPPVAMDTGPSSIAFRNVNKHPFPGVPLNFDLLSSPRVAMATAPPLPVLLPAVNLKGLKVQGPRVSSKEGTDRILVTTWFAGSHAEGGMDERVLCAGGCVSV